MFILKGIIIFFNVIFSFSREEKVGDKMEKLFRLVENLKGEIAEQRKASGPQSLRDDGGSQSGSRPPYRRNKSMDSIYSIPPSSAEICKGATFGTDIRKRTHPKISETDQE